MSIQTAAQKLPYPLPVPEPGLTPDMLVARAIALRPAIRAAQDDDDARGCHSPEMDKKFRDAGFYRILQPKMFGGYEFDYVTFYRVMLEIARGNPGVSWCLALGATHGALIASHWPERAQFELFGASGDFRAPHRVGVTTSTCQRADGGYIVDGTWNYCSGIPYATHFVGNVLLNEDGKPPQMKIFVVARSQLTVLDDWGGEATLGMRASGSNSVKLDKVFVPEHHVIDGKPALWANEPMDNGTPGTRLHGNPIYLGRYIAPYHMSLVVPVIGAARAALDEFEEKVMPRPTYHPPIMPRVEHFDSQRPFGYAMTLADSAEALLLAAAEKYMELCGAGARTARRSRWRNKCACTAWCRPPDGWRARRSSICSTTPVRSAPRRARSSSAISATSPCTAATCRRSISTSRRASAACISDCRSAGAGCRSP